MDNENYIKMTPRKRFHTALDHKIPDRIPIFDFLFSRTLYKEVLERDIKIYNNLDCLLLAKALNLDATLFTIGMSEGTKAKILTEDTFIDDLLIFYVVDLTN